VKLQFAHACRKLFFLLDYFAVYAQRGIFGQASWGRGVERTDDACVGEVGDDPVLESGPTHDHPRPNGAMREANFVQLFEKPKGGSHSLHHARDYMQASNRARIDLGEGHAEISDYA
jgi:hypothetical protein